MGKKETIIAILEILNKYSDAEHPINSNQIIRLLDHQYNLNCERKAISRSINALIEMGYDIAMYSETGKGYYLRERSFDDSELRLLIDLVFSSRFIPGPQAKSLLEKLKGLSSIFFAKKQSHINIISNSYHKDNKQLFYTVDCLSQAITNNKQISFYKGAYTLDLKLSCIDNWQRIANPYQLISTNEQYYLICNYEGYDNIVNIKLDRIIDIKMLESPSKPITELTGYKHGLDFEKYARETIYLHEGTPELIILKCKNYIVDDIVDHFGTSISIKPVDSEYCQVSFTAKPRGLRYWCLQYGRHCEVVAPESLRNTIINDIKDISINYHI